MTQAEVQAGQTVLVTGAGSGVSTFAIQWASALGAEVYVTSGSEEKIDKAKSIGATGDDMNNLLSTLMPAERFVFFGATLGVPSTGLEIPRLFFNQTRIQGTMMGSNAEFRAMLDFVSENKIEPVVDRILPMSEVIAAHKLLESFGQMGKVVLQNS